MIALVLDPTPASLPGAGAAARISTNHPEPVRGAGEALVGVRVTGVCDTDLQLARGYMGFSGVPGHEFVGEVLAADDLAWVGKRVVADINAGCGACLDCTTKSGHHCTRRSVLGIVGRSGAFAERLTIPERCLVEVPASLADDRAVFAEPLAAALHVLDDVAHGARGSETPPEARRAIVLGDGKLGQLIARALASQGIATTLVGHHEHKLALARSAGVAAFLEADLPAAQHGAGADLVVEATGSEAGLARALALVAPRGTVVLKTTVASKLTVDLAPVVIHEIRVVGSRCGDLKQAVSVLAKGSVDPTPLIEARYPLARADEALAHAGRRGALKVLVDGRVDRGARDD
jgi:threonine dehydrogenase-like Zn-dependent dehydrogenase